MESENADRICRLLQEEMDWNWMLKAAYFHGVWPIMYHNLKAACPDAVPQDILLNLQKGYLAGAMRNLMLSRELLRITEDFKEHGIEAVPFKGPTLAQAAYGDITLRSFSDLDVMVCKQNVLQARDILLSAGYRPEIPMTYSQEAKYLKTGCEYNFDRQSPNIHVEIHWRFLPMGYCVSFDEGIWSRLETMTFEETTICSFSLEDLVLALCAHAMKHQWAKIKLVSDIAGLIGRNQINWERVNIGAADMGLKRILHISLLLAHDLLDVGFPEQIFYEIGGDITARKLASHLTGMLFVEADRQKRIFDNNMLRMRTRERLKDRSRFLFLIITKPTQADYDMIHLPDSLYPLYRIIRPVRLFYQYGLKRKLI
ncbi:MAG: nucleotidyltransferase family protein [Methanothrix sp.]|nr:nucleotidyltransferase family protein [Methanothrix sp.]